MKNYNGAKPKVSGIVVRLFLISILISVTYALDDDYHQNPYHITNYKDVVDKGEHPVKEKHELMKIGKEFDQKRYKDFIKEEEREIALMKTKEDWMK